ncbi:hypothetical protein [Streptomyces sp. NPDC003863]
MATDAEGADIKKRINRAIHPPVDDAGKILAAADRVRIELPFFPPLCSSRSCKRAAGLRARHDCVPLPNG